MIDCLIFDFGGVLLDLDYQRTYIEMKKLLHLEGEVHEYPDLLSAMVSYEKGEINTETFLWKLQRMAPANRTPQPADLIRAWNAMLLGWQVGRFSFLESLRQQYDVYLLSNTNALHLEWVYADLRKNHGITEFDKRFFDQTFYSHQLGLRKPDESIYQHVCIEADLEPGSTLFIDDTVANVTSAISSGLQARWHDPATEIIDRLPEYLLDL